MKAVDLPVPLLSDQAEIDLGRAMRERRMSHIVAVTILPFPASTAIVD